MADGDLYRAAIYGRPIVLDLNRSCFLKDTEGVNAYGTVALNVTGSYFSEHEIDGKAGTKVPHYEDWVCCLFGFRHFQSMPVCLFLL